jgi:exodeoxyribonuclease V gamma subunit
MRFWRDPAKAWLRDAAGLSLEALDVEVWPDREPLKAAFERRERVESRLLFDALDRAQPEIPEAPPDWLARSGMLAAGTVGERAYAQARGRAQAALAVAREFLGGAAEAFEQPIDLDLGDGVRLSGSVAAFRRADGRIRLFGAKPAGEARFNELLPFYFRIAALRASLQDSVDADFVEYARNLRRPPLLKAIIEQDASQMRSGLRRLVDAALAVDAAGLLFPPRTAWEWVNTPSAQRAQQARKVWEGEFFPGERDYADYAALAARDWDFLDPQSPAHARFAQACELVAGVLDPHRTMLLRESARKRTA